VPLQERYAVALVELKRNDEALVVFQRILQLDPSNELAHAWLKKLLPPPPPAQPKPDASASQPAPRSP